MNAISCDVCGNAFVPDRKTAKRCSGPCRQSANRANALARQAANRPAANERARRFRETHREQRIADMRAYRAANPERDREYYEAHREQIIERARAYYAANRERCKARMRARAAAHPEILREAQRKRRERLLDAPGVMTDADWTEALEFFEHGCAYCGLSGDLHAEHVIPVSRQEHAPSRGPENIVPACSDCNRSKHARLVSEWRPGIVAQLVARVAPWNPELAANLALCA